MKGYKLSFAVGFALLIGAFIALYGEMHTESAPVGDSFVLLAGGVTFCIAGQMEYNKKKTKDSEES